MKLTINHKYMILQGLFWMLYCVAGGFISLCLQSRGLDNQGIGVVTAIFGIASALLQLFLGRICDKYPFLSWKKMILFLSVPFLIICILMTWTPGKLPGALFVGMLLLLGNTIMPFINSALSSYMLHGESINFGVSRGIGSGMYALLALLIGNLAADYGTNAVSISGIVISILFIIVTYSMPYMDQPEKHEQKKTSIQKGFIRRYPAFLVMYISFILLLTSHNLVGTYLLQIIQSFGGTSQEFGITIAIQAIVEVPVLFIFSFLLKKTTSRTLMVVAAFGYGIKALGYALSGSILAIYLLQFTQMLSFALYASASVYYTIDVIKKEDQITGQALMTSVLAIGTVIGSLTGGWVLDHYGINSMLWVNVFISGAGIILAVISNQMFKKRLLTYH